MDINKKLVVFFIMIQLIVISLGINISGEIIKNNNEHPSDDYSVFIRFFCDKNKNEIKDNGENYLEVYWYIYESVEIDLDYIDEHGYFNGIDLVEVNISLNENNRHRALLAHYPLRHAWFRSYERENAVHFYLEDSHMYEIPLIHPGGRIKGFNYLSFKQFIQFTLSKILLKNELRISLLF